MKINYGILVITILSGFMLFMGTMVFKCVEQKIDLVSDNYYEQEIKYQTHIDKETNTLTIQESFQINYNAAQKVLVINYPSDSATVSGNIRFFKPDNAELDFSLPVSSGQNATQSISLADINDGLWNVKVDWKMSGTDYYGEKKILIN
jgi:hypothetical protein